MIRRLLVFACLAAAVATSSAHAADAPGFSLPNAQGATTSLADLRGKVVVVDFWASWCVPCLKSFPWLSEIQAKYRDKGLVVVGVNLDKKADDAAKFLKRVPHDFTIVYDPDGASAAAYAVKAMPSSYLVDRKGQLVLSHPGFRETDKEALETAIQTALETR